MKSDSMTEFEKFIPYTLGEETRNDGKNQNKEAAVTQLLQFSDIDLQMIASDPFNVSQFENDQYELPIRVRSGIDSPSTITCNPLRKQRSYKRKDQLEYLELIFEKDTKWSIKKMKSLASLLGLTLSQVYKWNWDRQKSINKFIQENNVQN